MKVTLKTLRLLARLKGGKYKGEAYVRNNKLFAVGGSGVVVMIDAPDSVDMDINILEVVRAASRIPDPDIELFDNAVIIKGGGVEVELKYERHREGLTPHIFDTSKAEEVVDGEVVNGMRAFAKVAGRDELRDALEHIQLSSEGLVATNGSVLIYNESVTSDTTVHIHRAALELLSARESYRLLVDTYGYVGLEPGSGGYIIFHPPLESKYPEWKKVLPIGNAASEYRFMTKRMITACRAAKSLDVLSLAFATNGEVSAKSSLFSGRLELSCHSIFHRGDDSCEIWLSPALLHTALVALGAGENASIKAYGPHRGALLEVDESKSTVLIMPMLQTV